MALDFVAGCLAGMVGVVIGAPMDTVKTRLQCQDHKNPTYRGMFHCLRTIVKQESFAGLFKGITSPLSSVSLINAIVFGVEGNTARLLKSDSVTTHFWAGCVAGTVQCIICSPMELAKIRLQMQTEGPEALKNGRRQKYRSILHCLRKIYRIEGTRGVFKGFLTTVWREAPSYGVYFGAYHWLCRASWTDDNKDTSTLVMLFAGGSAGALSWISTYPFDVIKSRLQADINGKYKGMVDCAVQAYREEGIAVYGRGLGTTLVRAFPAHAATFVTFSWVMRLFGGEGQ